MMEEPAKAVDIPPSFNDVIAAFTQWRHTRQHKGRIPEHLWEATLSLARSYPPSKISQALHLNYSELKRRLDEQGLSRPSRRREASPFVEMNLSPGTSLMSPPGLVYPHCQIEVVSDRGVQIRWTVYGNEVPESILSLCRSLLVGDVRR